MPLDEPALLAVSVLTAAQEDVEFARRIMTQIVDEHRGGELIFGMVRVSWQLLRWLEEVSGLPAQVILERLSSSFTFPDEGDPATS